MGVGVVHHLEGLQVHGKGRRGLEIFQRVHEREQGGSFGGGDALVASNRALDQYALQQRPDVRHLAGEGDGVEVAPRAVHFDRFVVQDAQRALALVCLRIPEIAPDGLKNGQVRGV